MEELMGITAFNASALLNGQQSGIMGTMFAGNSAKNTLKSTEEKQKRQQETASQVAFWEEQKGALKDIKCETLEEIAEKLGMLSNYEQQIVNVKSQYNNDQMIHALDEAIERGEQLHEKIEESQKTPEEKRKEKLEEALGLKDEEESDGLMEELLEEVEEITDELSDGLLEEVLDENQVTLQQNQLTQGAEASNNKQVENAAGATVSNTTQISDLQTKEAAEAVTGQSKSYVAGGLQSYNAAIIEIPQQTYAHFDSAQ
jgi:hypothetical protein